MILVEITLLTVETFLLGSNKITTKDTIKFNVHGICLPLLRI
jgi:hypothetical protein